MWKKAYLPTVLSLERWSKRNFIFSTLWTVTFHCSVATVELVSVLLIRPAVPKLDLVTSTHFQIIKDSVSSWKSIFFK